MATHEVNAPTKETIADPAAVEPTTMASDASKDPIRPSGTDALVPESRPEVTDSTGAAATVPAGGIAATEPVGEKTVPKGSTVVEGQPINEGTLNYKGPGLVKSLMFSKKFVWFSEEPLEHKHLATYLGNEKSEVGHRNAAHATQTGNGLLLYAKRAEDKGHPAGILNLGEMTDFEKGSFNDFTFKINGHKHTFQAPSRAERDGWIVAIETRSSAAKESHEGLIGSDGYKNQLQKFANPTGAATTTGTSRSASRPKKTVESKPVESTTTDSKLGDLKADESKPAEIAAGAAPRNGSSSDEAKPKSKSKSRSQSRKRTSIFGTLLGKKEEHDDKKELKKEDKEEKKEIKKEQREEKAERKVEEAAIKHDVKKEDKAEKKAEKEELKLEKKEATPASGNMDAAAIAARVVGAPLANEGEIAPATTGTTAGTTGTTGLTGNTAGTTGTTGTTGLTGNTAGTTGETLLTSGTEPAAVTPGREAAPKANKRASIFGNFFGKKETASPIAGETAPAVPAKDGQTVAASSAAPQLEDPVSSPIAGATTTTAEPTTTGTNGVTNGVTTSVASPGTPDAKPQRRTSFFNNLGTKKEKRADGLSDAEGTDGETKKPSGSKLGGLFRKPSRATPAATTKTEPTAPTTAPVNESTEIPAPISKEEPVISDGSEIVPETATKTEAQQHPVQAY